MLFSVIVPVYGVEKYIHQCVDSVLVQSFRDFELILVDDGSPDNCPAICDEYAEKDERVVVLHQENGGLSAARNTGLKAAHGDYILFLDSDDYWDDPRALEQLEKRVGPDVLLFGYRRYLEQENVFLDPSVPTEAGKSLEKLCGERYIDRLVCDGYFDSSACNKVIKRHLMLKYGLFFRQGIKSEDVDWGARLLLAAQSMELCAISFYVYRLRAGSISQTVGHDHMTNIVDSLTYCISLIEQAREARRQAYCAYVAYQYSALLFLCAILSEDEKNRSLFQQMRKWGWLLDYHGNKKVRVLYLAKRLMGFRGVWLVCKLYGKIRR